MRAWAGDEQRRQRQERKLKSIEKLIGRSDGTARFARDIRCGNPKVDLDVVRAWAGDEQRRQRQERKLKSIEKLIGRSDGTARASDEDWASASRAAVRAVASWGLRRLDAASLVGVGNRAGAFQRGIRDAMKEALGWACTAMSMRSNFSLTAGLFDLVIIDEASQCTVAQALPLAYRAKRIAVVGDPNQLTPITGLLPKVHTRIAEHAGVDAENLKRTGIHHAEGSAYLAFEYQAQRQDPHQPFLLNEHYRSQPEIVRWFNREFYNHELTVLTELRNENDLRVPESTCSQPVMWTDVEGKAERGPKMSWVNREEARQVMRQMAVFMSYADLSVGIVAPFRGQVELLNELAKQHRLGRAIESSQLKLGTAHRFQGDECDLIIFSPVVAPGIGDYAAGWIEKERNLLNVAVSRARSGLIVFGHPQVGEFGGPTLASLRRYAIEEKARNLALEGRYRTDSRPEQLLLDAMRTAELDPVAKPDFGGYDRVSLMANNS